jgi:hypothetical protein
MKPSSQPETDVPERHRVLIAAAAAVACGQGARILGIGAVEAARENAWEQRGRAGIHASHNPAPKDSINRQLANRDSGARNR